MTAAHWSFAILGAIVLLFLVGWAIGTFIANAARETFSDERNRDDSENLLP